MSKRRGIICGICADELCEVHEQDCAFHDTLIEFMSGPCQCPNRVGENLS